MTEEEMKRLIDLMLKGGISDLSIYTDEEWEEVKSLCIKYKSMKDDSDLSRLAH